MLIVLSRLFGKFSPDFGLVERFTHDRSRSMRFKNLLVRFHGKMWSALSMYGVVRYRQSLPYDHILIARLGEVEIWLVPGEFGSFIAAVAFAYYPNRSYKGLTDLLLCRTRKVGVPSMFRNRPSQQQGTSTKTRIKSFIRSNVSWTDSAEHVV